MKLVMAFYEKAVEALSGGASLQDLINMPVREQIGRFKYVHEDDLDTEYEKVNQELDAEISAAQGEGGLLNAKRVQNHTGSSRTFDAGARCRKCNL